MQHLTILGSETEIERVCREKDLQPGAMLTADHLEIEAYPEPFTAVHGLRSVAARWRAGERVPENVMERFRKYLATHCEENWEDPNIFALIVALRLLPEACMEKAVQRAIELNDPATTAALLQYQHENFPKEQRNGPMKENELRTNTFKRGEQKCGDGMIAACFKRMHRSGWLAQVWAVMRGKIGHLRDARI